MENVDFHVHLWKKKFLSNGFKELLKNFAAMVNLEKFPDVDFTPEKYLAAIEPEKEKHREFGVKHAVILPTDYSFTSVKFKISYEDYLNYVVKVCDEYKGFFYSFVGPDPRHGPKALELLDYALGQCGFKGIILTPSTGFSLEDPIVDKMIQKAGEYKVPIIVHDTGTVPRPLELFNNFMKMDKLLSKYANQLFIFCPFSQMDTTSMKVGIRHSDHIMADITGFDSQYFGRKMPDMLTTQFFGALKENFGADKLLFGSDWPWWEDTAPITDWIKYIWKMKVPLIVRPFGLPSLDEEDKKQILGLNADRILNL